jgi:phage tail sheath protein FI
VKDKDTIRLLLRTQWRAGKLKGQAEEEAFTIICDRSTMTQDDILNGRLICDIGVAPLRPAEFVIIRLFRAPPRLIRTSRSHRPGLDGPFEAR